MNADIAHAFIAGALLFGVVSEVAPPVLRAIGSRLHTRRIRRQAQASAAALASAPAAAPMPAGDGWFPLPGGNRLEYKATGFAIELRPAHAAQPYHLVTPEGHTLATSTVLYQLKGLGMFAASERAQFEPSRKDGAA